MRLPWTVLPILLSLAAVPVRVSAAPAEVPPVGFSGRQYIDSTGCVFLRDREGGWQARLDQNGEAVCGYPPTPITGVIPAAPAPVAEGEAAHPAAAVPGNPSGDTELRDFALQGGGDDAQDPAALTGRLEAAVAAAPRVAGAAAAMAQRDSRLCALIGVSGHEPARPPTMMGFCGSSVMAGAGHDPGPASGRLHTVQAADAPVLQAAPAADALPARIAETGAGRGGSAGRAADADTATAAPIRGAAGQAAATARQPAAPAAAAGKATPRATAAGVPDLRPGSGKPASAPIRQQAAMIPATARYFVISRFRDVEPARAAAARLGVAGFPAAITTGEGESHHTLLAGPFSDRESMVRARERLLRAGFTPQGAR